MYLGTYLCMCVVCSYVTKMKEKNVRIHEYLGRVRGHKGERENYTIILKFSDIKNQYSSCRRSRERIDKRMDMCRCGGRFKS